MYEYTYHTYRTYHTVFNAHTVWVVEDLERALAKCPNNIAKKMFQVDLRSPRAGPVLQGYVQLYGVWDIETNLKEEYPDCSKEQLEKIRKTLNETSALEIKRSQSPTRGDLLYKYLNRGRSKDFNLC